MTPRSVNPPHYFLGSLVLMIGLAQIELARDLIAAPWQWLGIIPITAGVIVAMLAARQFGRVGTNIVPLTPSSTMVTDGMFRWSRNPMYVGMISTLCGVALLFNALLPWVVVVAFAVLLKRHFVRHEEALMTKTFGERYIEYQGRVRRWV